MKKLLFLVFVFFAVLSSNAQIFTPTTWSSEEVGDSVKLTAVSNDGWHVTIISIGEEEIGEEYYDGYSITLSKSQASSTPIRYMSCNDETCTAPEIYQYQTADATSAGAETQTASTDKSLLMIFILGLLGGFLAIFTPCVWPIIPMTVSFFLKQDNSSVKNGLLFGLSIIVIYVGLGLLVTVIFGASALNAFSTNAIVNLFFFALLVVFALSFFGLFEITLPSSWANKLDQHSHATSGLLSILLMAFTLVIVSFSCTGPIIGTLLVEAAGRSLLAPTIGMLGFSVALAIPFTLFSLFPNWLKKMPRSGGWMNVLKVSLAFIELAFALKFLSVADLAYGWGILPRWLFILLWTIIFALLGIYLLGWLRKLLPDDATFRWTTNMKKWNVHHFLRGILAICSLYFAGYLWFGVFGAQVRLIAAFAPPMPIESKAVFYDYEEGLQYAKQENKPILLDFTGYGCVNCRKMEAWVLNDDSVKKRLENYVLITLYVDDKHAYKDADFTIGDYNSKLQREQFGSNAQPFLVQLNAKGEKIAEPCAFITDPNEFLNWLKL